MFSGSLNVTFLCISVYQCVCMYVYDMHGMYVYMHVHICMYICACVCMCVLFGSHWKLDFHFGLYTHI